MIETLQRASFPSMGTTVALIGPGSGDPTRGSEFELNAWAVQTVFATIEARFSRFRAESELSRVNARRGHWTRVSREFAELLSLSLSAARETLGQFDPTMLEALVAAGYDRDYAAIRRGGTQIRIPPPPGPGWRDVELDKRKVRLPDRVQLDFGGVAKGWAVDKATEAVEGLSWAIINAGGDLRVMGEPPEGGARVAVEDPWDPARHILDLRLVNGALATSSVLSRTWGNGLHQLIDPRTRRPASTGILQATMWAPTCAQAEVRAKWAVLEGPSILEKLPGVLVLEDGRIVMNLAADEQALTVNGSAAMA